MGSRAWVLFALLRATLAGQPLVLVPDEVITSAKLEGRPIDVEHSACTRPDDWHYISARIRELGAEQVNAVVQDAIFGVLGVKTAAAEHNLGIFCTAQGQIHEAEPLLRSALKAREQLLGPMDPITLTSVNGLAVNRLACSGNDQAAAAEAEVLFRRALEERARLLGESHPDTLLSCNNLAALLQSKGEGHYEEAASLCRRSLRGYIEHVGADHVDTLTVSHNLGMLLEGMGLPDEAADHLRRALEGFERAYGPGHPDCLACAADLASLKESCGMVDEADTQL
eukprot:NODE_1871_length_1045_cov_378.921212.p1 GENE.NODE_1871_length_1045_cov_378.921212~~NODE_1871_length_1045_cov_378.921212.p1  ORF type:complete len:283 (+),score=98.26 NODE_1871_length_1045_cov_378.921212:3-851(+)